MLEEKMAIPPHTHPHPPPDTMGRWPRRLRPLLYVIVFLIILIAVAVVSGQIFWVGVLFVIIFVTIIFGIIWSRTHPEEA
ncbi:MAG: hypothetical protein ACFE89_06430 [Candidatus Hodarchaeota archaeon]